MSTKTRVAVVFGGRDEGLKRSLHSAQFIMDALDKSAYDVVGVGITKQGKWLTGDNVLKCFEKNDYSGLSEVFINTTNGSNELIHFDHDTYQKINIDIFFPVLHGIFGGDGTIQGLFEMSHVPYTGCGVLGAALAMDKLVCKAMWEQAGLPVIPYIAITKKAWEDSAQEVIYKIKTELGYPVFVKPAHVDSFSGILKAKKPDEFRTAIDKACKFDHRILIEAGLNIREFRCGVMGNDNPETSKIAEVLNPGEEKPNLKIPADIPTRLEQEIKHMALKAYKIIDCCGFAQVDLFWDKSTHEIYINEINPSPQFDKDTYLKMWKVSDISSTEFFTKVINLGFEKFLIP